jgi:hypothetical protein
VVFKQLVFPRVVRPKAKKRKADERTRTADLLITSELLKSRESDLRCFSLLLVSQHSIRCGPLEADLLRAVGQEGAELKFRWFVYFGTYISTKVSLQVDGGLWSAIP